MFEAGQLHMPGRISELLDVAVGCAGLDRLTVGRG